MEEWSYTTLNVIKKGRVLTVFFNRPETRNALDMEMRYELSDLISRVSQDASIGAMVLTGNGKAFCSGGDLKTMQTPFPTLAGRRRLKDLHDWLKKLVNLEIPVLAAINGYATGAGFNLALACDIRIASETAEFSQSFVKVGLVPDSAGLYYLPRLVGLAKAKELMFTGKMIGVHEAKELGLLNQVVEAEKLLEVTEQLAVELANGPKAALALTKRILNLSETSNLEEILEFEAMAQDICYNTPEFEEGKKAFFEKRSPNFKNLY